MSAKKKEEYTKARSFLTRCDGQSNVPELLDAIGATCKSFPAKNGQEPPISNIWTNALFMTGQGFKVFPLTKQGKTPLISGWQAKATVNETFVKSWARQLPDHNYGVVTGEEFFVIDIDLGELGDLNEEIAEIQKKLGPFELGTLVKTGRGYQLYCSSGGVEIWNDHEKRLTDRVDIKGAGGYVVGAGSIHPNGTRMSFVIFTR